MWTSSPESVLSLSLDSCFDLFEGEAILIFLRASCGQGWGRLFDLSAVFSGLTACVAGRPSVKAWSSAERCRELTAPGRGE